MSKADKRQRQKARRAAAEAARKRAELRKRRTRAGIILGVALGGIAILLAAIYMRPSGDAKPTASATTSATPPPPIGKGISCPTAAPANPREYPGQGPMLIAWDSKAYSATVKTNFGEFTIFLYSQDAPITVNNFVSLACDGFYNSTKFHRISTSPSLSVLQGGDATRLDGTGNPGYTIADELTRAKQDGYRRGTVAMANSGSPDSGGSQFFVVVKDSTLPPQYTVFGTVSNGMDVVDKMFAVGSTSPQGDGPPAQDLKIESISVQEVPLADEPAVPSANTGG